MPSLDSRDAIVLGGTNVLQAWVADVLQQACANAGVVIHAAGRYVDPIARVDESRRILLVKFPDRPTLDAIEARLVRVVAVIDDPVDSVRYLQALRGCDLLQALREQTGSAAAHHLVLDNPEVLVVRRGAHAPAASIVEAMLSHLRLDLGPAAREALRDAFCGSTAEPFSLEEALKANVSGYLALDQVPEDVAAADGVTIRQVLSPLVAGALSRDIGPVTWPNGVFYYGDTPNEIAPRVVDLTGHIRSIYYGPYLHLPPGVWIVRCVMAFTLEARHTPFRIVVQCNLRPLAKVLFRPEAEGAFEASFTFQHSEPEHSVEINLINEEGSIGGHMALGQVTFTRLGSPG